MATGPTREKWERQEDMRTIVKLLRRGYSHTRIAQSLGVSPAQVGRDIKAMMSEAQEMILADRVQRDAKSHLQDMLDQLEEVKQEAWETWDWSKGRMTENLRAQLMQALISSKGSLPEHVTLRLSQMPDAVYLKTIMGCLGQEAKLLGLDKSTGPSINVNATAAVGLSWDQLIAKPSSTPADSIEKLIQDVTPLGGNLPSSPTPTSSPTNGTPHDRTQPSP